ncbi:hypothetical protein HPC49_53380, partial [Pyxidicoccus fallax]
APSRTKAPHTPASTARNEVRAYDGPPARTPQGPAPKSTPAASGPTVSAGELAASGGRVRQASSSEVPEQVYDAIRSNLKRDFQDWAVTDCDVKAVHTVLGTLQPGVYRAALERMERDGLLGTYTKEMDASARHAFLEQAESKGLLQRKKGDAPAGPLGYPAVPDFFRDDAKLPASMRDAVNQHDIQVGVDFHRAYSAYLDRYAEAVGAAKSLPELQALGLPKEARLEDSGLHTGQKDRASEGYLKAWRQGIGQPESLNRTYQLIRAKQLTLEGERPTGIQVHGKAEFSHEALNASRELQLDTRGRVELKDAVGLAVKAGPLEVEETLDSAGKAKQGAKVNLGFIKLSTNSEGDVKVGLGVGKAAEVYVELNPAKAEFGGGVSSELDLKVLKLAVETGFNMKGLTSDRVKESFDKNHQGIFDSPPKPGPTTK